MPVYSLIMVFETEVAFIFFFTSLLYVLLLLSPAFVGTSFCSFDWGFLYLCLLCLVVLDSKCAHCSYRSRAPEQETGVKVDQFGDYRSKSAEHAAKHVAQGEYSRSVHRRKSLRGHKVSEDKTACAPETCK